MKKVVVRSSLLAVALSLDVNAAAGHKGPVADEVLARQQFNLLQNTQGKGYGPQSPRDIDSVAGKNPLMFSTAPRYSQMNLCNIHFHKNAEHKGGQFKEYAGNGDGQGNNTGYRYSGSLTRSELAPVSEKVCLGKHGSLSPGDTIEVHYVFSSAQVVPGPTLGACLSDSVNNPHLRVEAQVFVLVNDRRALDFAELSRHGKKNGLYQPLNLPDNTGTSIVYRGSTTGPGYNEAGSPFLVTWSVRPKVAKVNIDSVGQWCKGNVFKEDHAHGVRNLVTDPALLSPIE